VLHPALISMLYPVKRVPLLQIILHALTQQVWHLVVQKVIPIPLLQGLFLFPVELRLAPIVLEGLLGQWRVQYRLDSIVLEGVLGQ
jgi:hypothetical protein